MSVRRWVRIGMVALALAAPGAAAQGPATQGNQWEKEDYYVGAAVKKQTLAICGSSTEKRKGKSVEITVNCREADGAGSGKTVTLRGYLYNWNGNRWEAIRKCKDTHRTSGNTSRTFELACSVNLPSEAR